MSIKAFTTPGSISYKPTQGVSKIRIIVTGGGSRGYGFLGWGDSLVSKGAGGGAGGTAIAFLDVDPSKTYAGVVGQGSNNLVLASSSTFNGIITANNGGSPAGGYLGGTGGTAVGGDINISGGDGSDSPGWVPATTNAYRGGSGDGGVSYWGGGSKGSEVASSVSRGAYGAGGGGNDATNPYIGNYGQNGIIYIEEYA